MSSEEPTVVASAIVSVVLEPDGQMSLMFHTEGDLTDWQALGMLDYAASVIRGTASYDEGVE